MKKNLLSLALCALSLANLASCGKTTIPTGFEKGTIKIGLSGPLTEDYAAYGTAVLNSAALAAYEINQAGGLNGVKFSVEAYDDKGDPATASTNYTSLKEKGMQISLGCVTSGACLSFAQDAIKDGYFCLTPSATNDSVPEKGVYQVCFKDGAQAEKAVEYITTNAAGKKVGVLYNSEDDYSKGLYDYFAAHYADFANVTAAAFTNTEEAFTSQVQKLKDCDFIFMPIYYTPAAKFIEAGKSTMKATATYFGCDGLDGINTVEGFDVNAYTQKISMLTHFDSKSDRQVVKDYVANYTKYFGEGTLNQFGAGAYDCVYAIYNALKASGGTFTADSTVAEFTTALNAQFSSSTFKFTGVTGENMSWNADHTVSKAATQYTYN